MQPNDIGVLQFLEDLELLLDAVVARLASARLLILQFFLVHLFDSELLAGVGVLTK